LASTLDSSIIEAALLCDVNLLQEQDPTSTPVDHSKKHFTKVESIQVIEQMKCQIGNLQKFCTKKSAQRMRLKRWSYLILSSKAKWNDKIYLQQQQQ